MNHDEIPDVLSAMLLAKFEVRLTFDPLALEKPFCCYTYKVAHGDSEAPWSHSAYGRRLVEAVDRSWQAVNPV